jgi:hypothetical protein
MPELAGFVWPDRSAHAELESLKYQSSRFVYSELTPEQVVDFKKAATTLAELTSQATVVKDSFTLNLARFIPYMNLDSSPGMPLAAQFVSKAEVIDKMSITRLNEIVGGRLLKLLSTSLEDVQKMSPEELVSQGYLDPVRIFIKNEPHSLEKAALNRWRLIGSVSIIDEGSDRFLFQQTIKDEMLQWPHIPVKPGISFDPTGASAYALPLRKVGEVLKTDIQAWDWSQKTWCFEMYAFYAIQRYRFICARHREPALPMIEHLIRMRLFLISRKVYALSDGRLFVGEIDGVLPSGCFITSNYNSTVRVLVGRVAGARWINAQGDDANEDAKDHELRITRYESFGFLVKDIAIEPSSCFHFCSHLYVDTGTEGYICWPVNLTKMIYRTLSEPYYGDDDPRTFERMASLRAELAWHPKKDVALEFIARFWPLNAVQEGV